MSKKKLRTFRLLVGSHSEGIGDKRKIYRPGEVIKTTADLNKMNSRNSLKFEELGGLPQETPKDDKVDDIPENPNSGQG